MSEKLKAGWWMPGNSRKYHWFVNGRSLCGKWGCFASVELEADLPGTSKYDCAACCKKLHKPPPVVKVKHKKDCELGDNSKDCPACQGVG